MSWLALTPGAYFDGALDEFILPYNAVRDAAEPDALLLDFLSQLTQPRWGLATGPRGARISRWCSRAVRRL